MLYGQVWRQGLAYVDNTESGYHRIKVTEENKVLVFLDFQNEITFANTKIEGNEAEEMALLICDSALNVQNYLVIGSIGLDRVGDVDVDSAGNIFVSGYYSDSLTIGDLSIESFGSSDYFVAKLNSYLEPIWLKTMGSKTNDGNALILSGLRVNNGDVICTGTYSLELETSSFLIEDTSITGYGKSDVFITKLSGINGKMLWTKIIGGGGSDYTTSNVDTDKHGNVYSIVNPAGSVIFDGEKLENPYYEAQSLLLCLDGQSGRKKWHFGVYNVQFGTNFMNSVVTDTFQNAYITGSYFTPEINVGGEIFLDRFHLNGVDAYLAKIDSSGKLSWASRIQGASTDGATDLAISPRGDIVSTGYYSGKCLYRGDSVTNLVSSVRNGYVLKVDGTGKPLYFGSIGGSSSTSLNNVSVIGDSKVIISGVSGFGKCSFDGDLMFEFAEDRNQIMVIGNTDSVMSLIRDPVYRSFVIRPNPVNDMGVFTNPFEGTKCHLSLMDNQGRIIMGNIVYGEQIYLDVSELIPGVYTLILSEKDSLMSYHTKLLKN